MPKATPLLLHFRVSHYNEKVRWALDRKRIPHRLEDQVPAFHLPRVRWVSGQNQVPVLCIDGRVITGSATIIEALESRQPQPPLLPPDPVLRERALAIQRHFDTRVAPGLRRVFWSCYLPDPAACARLATDGFGARTRIAWRAAFSVLRPMMVLNMGLQADRVARARERVQGHFDQLESDIGPSGFLAGDAFSIADLTAAAVMTAIVRPAEFPFPLPEPRPERFSEWQESFSGHPAFQWVTSVYRAHRDPSAAVASH